MSQFLSLKVNNSVALGLLSLMASFLLLANIFKLNVQPGNYKGNDIFYIWSDGHAIANGENPYSKIHGSDMRKNQKYSTYLPGFFLIVSVYVKLGFETFSEWMSFWRPTSFLIHCFIGLLLYFVLLYRAGFWLALLGAHFWLISRWPIGIMNSGQIDSLAILLLLLSLLLLPSRKNFALVLFGASLSIKQIGIFMLPVFILLSSDLAKPFLWNVRQGFRDLFYISIVPFILCLPFLISDAQGVLMSMLFSATRSPGGHLKVQSLDEILGYAGLVSKIPMIFMLATVYFLVLEKKIGKFVAGLAVFLIFISFNSVLFKQYMPWFCAFLGLAIAESQRIAAGYQSKATIPEQINARAPN